MKARCCRDFLYGVYEPMEGGSRARMGAGVKRTAHAGRWGAASVGADVAVIELVGRLDPRGIRKRT